MDVRHLALAAVCLLSSACFLDPTIEQNRIRREALDLHARALELEGRGGYDEALRLHLDAIALSPRPAFYFHAGHCHARMGHLEQAVQYFDKALETSPNYELARTERDLALEQLRLGAASAAAPSPGDASPPPSGESPRTPLTVQAAPAPAEAAPAPTPPPDYRRALFPELHADAAAPFVPWSPDPDSEGLRDVVPFPPSAETQIDLAESGGQLDRAAFYLEEELKKKPDDWEMRLRLARVLARTGRFQSAEEQLREATRLAPDNADLWHEWGSFYVRQSEWDKAESCYRECLRIEPRHARARNNLGVILMRREDWDAAREEFDLLVADHPGFSSPHLNLAIIESRRPDRAEQAIAQCDDYLRLGGPRAAEVRRWRQQLLLKRGSEPAAPAPAPTIPGP